MQFELHPFARKDSWNRFEAWYLTINLIVYIFDDCLTILESTEAKIGLEKSSLLAFMIESKSCKTFVQFCQLKNLLSTQSNTSKRLVTRAFKKILPNSYLGQFQASVLKSPTVQLKEFKPLDLFLAVINGYEDRNYSKLTDSEIKALEEFMININNYISNIEQAKLEKEQLRIRKGERAKAERQDHTPNMRK